MEKKFEITNEITYFEGRTLHRIRALKDFGDVKKGDLGGFVEKESNLNQDKKAWVYDNAKICDGAVITDNAIIKNNAVVSGNAKVCSNAEIYDFAIIKDSSLVGGNVKVCGEADVYGNALIIDNAYVGEKAKVFGFAVIQNSSKIEGRARICDRAIVSGDDVIVKDNAFIKGHAIIADNAQIFGHSCVADTAKVCENAKVYGASLICDCALVKGNAEICDCSQIRQNSVIKDFGKVSQNQIVSSGITKTDLSKDFATSIRVQCNLPVINNKVIAYKLVRPDFTSFHDKDFKYEIGKIAEVENCDMTNESCAAGLHFGNITYWEIEVEGEDFICLEAEIDLDDVITVQEGKIRCKKAKILRAFTF